jgi:hypothetical protein
MSNVAAAGVRATIVPAEIRVAPGEAFDLEVLIEPDEPLNGYEMTIGYDPSRLLFLPRSPLSDQEGDLMVGACGDRWHRFEAAEGTLTLSHVLLCAGARVSGSGVVYRLRFEAKGVAGETAVRIESARFADAGRVIEPVETEGADVSIVDGGLVASTWGRIKALYRAP